MRVGRKLFTETTNLHKHIKHLFQQHYLTHIVYLDIQIIYLAHLNVFILL